MTETETRRDVSQIPSRPDFVSLLQQSGRFEQAEGEIIINSINARMELVEREYGENPLLARVATIMTGAIDYARACALKLQPERVDEHGDALTVGDVTTKRDIEIYRRVVEVLDSTGMKFVMRGEIEAKLTKTDGEWEIEDLRADSTGKKITSSGTSNCPEGEADWVFVIDPLDGSVNETQGKKSGTVLACAKYGGKLKMRDLEIGVVADYLAGRNGNERGTQRCVGVRGLGARLLRAREIERITLPEPSPLDEVPTFGAYTKFPWQEEQQKLLARVVSEVLGQKQQRSTDATAACSVAVATGEFRTHCDAREATKLWDTIASWVVINEVTGLKMTDLFGFSFDEAVLYDPANEKYAKDGGINRAIGKHFVIGREEDNLAITRGYCEAIFFGLRASLLPAKRLEYWHDAGEIFARILEHRIDMAEEDYGIITRSDVERFVCIVRDFYCRDFKPLADTGRPEVVIPYQGGLRVFDQITGDRIKRIKG
ncbi:MAG TPA: inositol monophosphatase family protein [Candidatus Bathyarchaeia archaeon]|nr:inositol monophosphatase family protein [Candidatus Bathyarchaeia archaeon]